jgi:hypothetical protein
MRIISNEVGFIDRDKERMIFNRLDSLGLGPQNLGETVLASKKVRFE